MDPQPRYLLKTIFAIAFSLVWLPHSAQAQDVPTVTVMHAGVDRMLEDLKYVVVDLAGEKKIWQDKLAPNIDVFLPGIDTTRPIRYDVLLDPDAKNEQARPSFPLLKRKERTFLQQNIAPLGIKVRQKRRGVYECRGAFEGWLQFNEDYATFAEQADQIPAKFDPFADIKAPFEKGLDLHAILKNSADKIKDRQAAFKPVRENILAALKKKDEESQAEFALRKLGVEQQLDELERFFVEAAEIAIANDTDIKQGTGFTKLTLKALPGTDLEKSVKMLAEKPSYFANAPIDEKALAYGRINFPLDDFRKKHLADFYPLLRPVLAAKIDSAKDTTAEQKTAAKKAVDGVISMLEAGIEVGVVDGFFESQLNADKMHNFVLGVRAINGKDADEIVKLIPAIDTTAKLTAGYETLHGVVLHKLEFTGKVSQFITSFFGGETTMIVGTSEKTVWFAGGVDAEAKIKTAIEQVAKAEEAKPSPVVVEFSGELQPVLKALDEVLGTGGNVDVRKIALESLNDGGRLKFDMKLEGETVVGTATVDKPILRFIGEMIADFADKQL